MYRALCDRDSRYEGVFVVAVTSTGIFCRPTCPARKPRPDNVRFFAEPGEALAAGFRACRRCRPLHPTYQVPAWIEELLAEMARDPSRRWTDRQLQRRGVDPVKLRRWFKRNYGMTFHGFQRSRRLSLAAGQIRDGRRVTEVALDNGYESLSGFRDAFRKWTGEVPGSARQAAGCLTLQRLGTPLGTMVAGCCEQAVALLEFADRVDLESQINKLVALTKRRAVAGSHPLLETLQRQLNGYFLGQRRAFDVPLVLPGTPFQQATWRALQDIPYGQTRSYRQLAGSLGRPGGSRAVGRANAGNRIAILVPCHRVVRSDGSPGGYAGEVWRKQRLLDLESASRVPRFTGSRGSPDPAVHLIQRFT
jgi:AraC family transcriptional regulator of adaptative response/methylated-DNA-[protein]-cysteine methyltransferase